MGEGPVRQHCHVRRHHHVPWYCRPYAEGDHRPGSLHHQDQDHRSPREEVLRLDRRLHPGFPLHLPADVDLQAGIRRVRPLHCPPQVLLANHNFRVRKTTYWNLSPPSSSTCQWGFPFFSIQPYFHCPADWSADTVQLHSTLYYIPSSTLTFSLCLQNISSRDFVHSLTFYCHHFRNIRILCVISCAPFTGIRQMHQNCSKRILKNVVFYCFLKVSNRVFFVFVHTKWKWEQCEGFAQSLSNEEYCKKI